MKFWSVMRLSLHNLANNKLRTLLTVIVLFIMATVVMVMVGFGASFFKSTNLSTEKLINESGNSVSITEQVIYESEYGNYTRSAEFLDMSVVQEAVDFYEGEDNFFSTIEFVPSNNNSQLYSFSISDGNYGEYFYAIPIHMGSNFLVGQENYLINGRMWNASDEGTNNIWLGESFLTQFELGEEIMFEGREEVFNVRGFIKNESNYNGSQAVYIDYKKFDSTEFSKTYNNNNGVESEDTEGELCISSVRYKMIQQEGVLYGDKTISQLKSFRSAYDTTTGNNTIGIYVSSSVLDSLSFAMMMQVVVIGVLGFVAVLIILLSIGSVSNTIKITVEQNRKFFGMMKAIGMQNKTVRRVVQWQAIFMVAVGTLLATGVVIGLMFALEPILIMLLTMMFDEESMILSMSMPVFVPFIVFFALVGFVLLFTVKNLNKISKMDVIAVISEVD